MPELPERPAPFWRADLTPAIDRALLAQAPHLGAVWQDQSPGGRVLALLLISGVCALMGGWIGSQVQDLDYWEGAVAGPGAIWTTALASAGGGLWYARYGSWLNSREDRAMRLLLWPALQGLWIALGATALYAHVMVLLTAGLPFVFGLMALMQVPTMHVSSAIYTASVAAPEPVLPLPPIMLAPLCAWVVRLLLRLSWPRPWGEAPPFTRPPRWPSDWARLREALWRRR